MEQTNKNIIQQNDLTETRKIIVIISLFLSMLPGVILILCNLLTDLEGPNPFLMLLILMGGAPILIVGMLTYLIADNKLKRKLIFTGALIVFQTSVLPIIWLTNDIKIRAFLFNNRKSLEFIANNVLDNKWSWEYATEYTASKNLPVKLTEHIEEDKTVLFLAGGILDNCFGIAYSRTGNETTDNNCGHLVKWKKIKANWYRWGTT